MSTLIFSDKEKFRQRMLNISEKWKHGEENFLKLAMDLREFIRENVKSSYKLAEELTTNMFRIVYLPSYEAKESEIDKMMYDIERFLKIIGFSEYHIPLITTIARSEFDECKKFFLNFFRYTKASKKSY